jgi:hypothetical protein
VGLQRSGAPPPVTLGRKRACGQTPCLCSLR